MYHTVECKDKAFTPAALIAKVKIVAAISAYQGVWISRCLQAMADLELYQHMLREAACECICVSCWMEILKEYLDEPLGIPISIEYFVVR